MPAAISWAPSRWWALESTIGGVVDCSAPPPAARLHAGRRSPGTNCDNKVVDMVLEYNGQAPARTRCRIRQSGFAKCSGNATGASTSESVYTGSFGSKQTVLPSPAINNGDRIRVTSTWAGNGLNALTELQDHDSGGCAAEDRHEGVVREAVQARDEFGSLKVVEFTTKSGQHVALGGDPGPFQSCEVPLAPPGPHCTSDLQSLSLVYIGNFLGAGCSVSNPQGGYGTCSGVADPGDPVSVSIEPGLVADPDNLIEFGDLVTITQTSEGDLPGLTNLTVTGAGGSQTIQIKTSCYKPLTSATASLVRGVRHGPQDGPARQPGRQHPVPVHGDQTGRPPPWVT